MAVFEEILYPPPSVLMKVMSVISLISLMNFGLSEARGKHLQYSKFTSNSSGDQQQKSKVEKKEQIKISSRSGMLLLYAPAFLMGAISFWIFPNHDFRFMLVDSALTLHFFKRVLEVVMSVFGSFLFPPPPSLLITSLSAISFISLTNGGISEIKGKNIQYSKFWKNNKKKKMNTKVKENNLPTKTGMLVLYTPPFILSALSLWIFSPQDDLRFMLVTSALTIHFFKRVFEVLFIHRYSGGMAIDSVIPISLSYFISTASMIYNQHLLQGIPEPPVDLKYAGVILFSVGILGNFYHHYLLSKLREKDDKGYKIPKGGLFGIIICPHYLFEIIIFVGVSLISQSLYPLCFTIGTAMYLTGRSYATRKWYVSKFPNFPNNIKALIPFIF